MTNPGMSPWRVALFEALGVPDDADGFEWDGETFLVCQPPTTPLAAEEEEEEEGAEPDPRQMLCVLLEPMPERLSGGPLLKLLWMQLRSAGLQGPMLGADPASRHLVLYQVLDPRAMALRDSLAVLAALAQAVRSCRAILREASAAAGGQRRGAQSTALAEAPSAAPARAAIGTFSLRELKTALAR